MTCLQNEESAPGCFAVFITACREGLVRRRVVSDWLDGNEPDKFSLNQLTSVLPRSSVSELWRHDSDKLTM